MTAHEFSSVETSYLSQLYSIVANIPHGVITLSESCDVDIINGVAVRLLSGDPSLSPHDFVDKHYDRVMGSCSSLMREFEKRILQNYDRSFVLDRILHNDYVLKFKCRTMLHGYLLIIENITKETKLLEELEKLAITDKLTGIFNRVKIDTVLDSELVRARRSKEGFGVIMLDIDHFKNVNDTYGHQAGDGVLREIAGILQKRARKSDTVGRWGGEEFLMVCPLTNTEGLQTIAEVLREEIACHEFGQVGKATASFGIAAHKSGESLIELVSRADDALYQAKERGRNCVECADD